MAHRNGTHYVNARMVIVYAREIRLPSYRGKSNAWNGTTDRLNRPRGKRMSGRSYSLREPGRGPSLPHTQ